MDKVKHFILCFGTSLLTNILFPSAGFGWWAGLLVGITVEGTQAEINGLTWANLVKHSKLKDTHGDLVADALGILAAEAAWRLLK